MHGSEIAQEGDVVGIREDIQPASSGEGKLVCSVVTEYRGGRLTNGFMVHYEGLSMEEKRWQDYQVSSSVLERERQNQVDMVEDGDEGVVESSTLGTSVEGNLVYMETLEDSHGIQDLHGSVVSKPAVMAAVANLGVKASGVTATRTNPGAKVTENGAVLPSVGTTMAVASGVTTAVANPWR